MPGEPYKRSHRSLTLHLLLATYDAFVARARALGLTPLELFVMLVEQFDELRARMRAELSRDNQSRHAEELRAAYQRGHHDRDAELEFACHWCSAPVPLTAAYFSYLAVHTGHGSCHKAADWDAKWSRRQRPATEEEYVAAAELCFGQLVTEPKKVAAIAAYAWSLRLSLVDLRPALFAIRVPDEVEPYFAGKST